MRRYSRYKICKTNFHFFHYSSRILNFNRPKWNLLKEKIEIFKKQNKQQLQNKYKIKYSRLFLRYFFNMGFLFKPVNNIIECKKGLALVSECSTENITIFFSSKNSLSSSSFDYLFLD